MQHLNQPTLQTERLLLKQLTPADVNEIFLLRSNESANKYIDRPLTKTMDDAMAFIQKIEAIQKNQQTYFWTITVKGEATIAGTVTLWNINEELEQGEIGYELLPAYYKKGIMSEAVRTLLHFAFEEMKIKKIEGWVHPENDRSISLLHKLGFIRDAVAEQSKPEDANEIIYSLLSNDYLYR